MGLLPTTDCLVPCRHRTGANARALSLPHGAVGRTQLSAAEPGARGTTTPTPDAGLRAVPDSPVPGQADGRARPRLGMRGALGTPQPAPRGHSPSSGSTPL